MDAYPSKSTKEDPLDDEASTNSTNKNPPYKKVPADSTNRCPPVDEPPKDSVSPNFLCTKVPDIGFKQSLLDNALVEGSALNETSTVKSVCQNSPDDKVNSEPPSHNPREGEVISMEVEEEPIGDLQIQSDGEENFYYYDSSDRQKEVLNKLGLSEYYPEKLTIEIIKENSSSKLESLTDLPWYLLTKILMLNCRGRDQMLQDDVPSSDDEMEVCNSNAFNEDILFPELEDSFSSSPHPMDVLVVTYRCCSNFVRQLLSEKMFMCKLGIPLVLPPFLNSKPLFLLWALRNIALEYEKECGEPSLRSVVNHPTYVVSCVRLGKIIRSKSKFLNEILNEQSHPTFYHRDCKGGMNDRTLSEGLIEIAWCLQSRSISSTDGTKTSEKNHFQTSDVALLNLRGDGKFHGKSMSFLCEISDVVLVMIDINDLHNESVVDALRLISSHNIQVILLLGKQLTAKISERTREDMKRCAEMLKFSNYGKDNIVCDFHIKGEKNIKLLKKEIEDKMSRCLRKKSPKNSFARHQALAKSLDIRVDENIQDCIAGRERALKIIDIACEDGKESLRTTKLPLQCKPWQEWSKLTKEECRREKRGKEEISIYMDKLHKEKKKQRKEQAHLIQKSTNKLFDVFLENLLHSVAEERLYYLKWLKLYLDDISREVLPGLQNKFSSKWNEIRKCTEEEKMSSLKRELCQFEEKLASSSFGLEHFIREIAQAYEAVQDVGENISQEIKERILSVPKVMAELMLLGYPLELMDGDAASVPLSWIRAVLYQLKKLIGDKKIFVLSVLGIQSSGKSTMLNAMFGLQFAVSAGRCTRGVFAQLMPVPKELSSDIYDYILVVDTEGLRAAELGHEKVQHDNEIATLVIGLGDVTLVNIKGENVAEIEDVLQIVIHALLKMMIVNKNLALQPSCFFVHQNVPAPDAAQQLKGGQQKFIETLDKVTKAVGKQEGAPQYTKFSEVIDFDINTNISYFSDLWKGDPPMGHANPGYSENIARVKEILLKDIMQKRTSHLTISKFCTKINDLWKGILDQNFVFSFKNNLEMEAYSYLEMQLSDQLWLLKKTALKWQSDKENVILSSEHGIENLKNSLTKECCSHLQNCYNDAEKKLSEIFEDHEDRKILEQWRSTSFRKLKNCFDDVIDATTRTLSSKAKARQIQVDQVESTKMYKDMILKEAENVASDLKSRKNGQNFSDKELEVHFSNKWDEFIKKLPQNHEDNINIEESIKNVLFSKFSQDFVLMKKALEDLHIKDVTEIKKNFNSSIDKYVKRPTKSFLAETFEQGKEFLGFSNTNGTYKNTLRKIESLTQKTKGKFELRNAAGFLAIAKDLVTEIKDSESSISNEMAFEMHIAICTCQYATYALSKKGVLETVNNGKYQMGRMGIHPYFEEELIRRFSSEIKAVLHTFSHKSLIIISKDVILENGIDKKEAEKCVDSLICKLNEIIESYVDKSDIQGFREEYVEEIIHIVKAETKKLRYIILKKESEISLVVHFCYLALPKFIKKHRGFIDNLNPRKVLKRDYYDTYLQIFKNSYRGISGEKALSMVICELLITAMQTSVDKEMAADLVEDVRNNVPEVKMKIGLLKAILMQLLENENFDDFMLYLEDTNACFEKWISFYIDHYLFSDIDGKGNRYSKIASDNISSKLSEVCKDVLGPVPDIPKNTSSSEALSQWIDKFQKRILGKLAISQQDLCSLIVGHEILNITSFTDKLQKNLEMSKNKLKEIFCKHTEHHLQSAHEVSIYKLIYRECKGCTEKCPFCSAPCSMSTAGHIEKGQGMKHMVKEHHPQACGKYRWECNNKLVVDNCQVLTASDYLFRNHKTEMVFKPYKEYQEIYPDWKIDGDPTIDASPYWKWFLVKYESELAERYNAKRPNIPSSWRDITKEQASESVKKQSWQ